MNRLCRPTLQPHIRDHIKELPCLECAKSVKESSSIPTHGQNETMKLQVQAPVFQVRHSTLYTKAKHRMPVLWPPFL